MLAGAILCAAAMPAAAEEWSDTSISWSSGSRFAEPFGRTDIGKNIFGFTHVGGYKYGTQLVAADLLLSDKNDPAAGGAEGAQEVYAVYRNTVDFSKVTGQAYKFGAVKGVGATFGFDFNTKNDGYASKKRMFVFGPTFMMDVPGMLNLSVMLLKESNAPTGVSRYSYKVHPMFEAVWGLPIGGSGFSFEGLAMFIGSKGKDEFGGQTKAETNITAKLMYDAGPMFGGPKNTLKLGVAYQYWKNKFGNDSSLPGNAGSFAKTPMVRAEYHF